jgi:hypothetical protein
MKVSFHPAQVGTPNKDKEGSSRFKILETPPKKKDLLLTQVPSENQARFHFLLPFI